MQNIEIKRSKNKRSIESLIQDSAIDNSFNYQAHQLRKAFNQTLMAMNAKNTDKDKQIQKLKIVIKQYQENRTKNDNKIKQLQEELIKKNSHMLQLNQNFKENKKRLQYLEYKIENINQNRSLFDKTNSYEEDSAHIVDRKKIKNQIYNQVSQIIAKKIQSFTFEVKKCVMTFQVQKTIESFLEELIYINPYSESHFVQKLKMDKRINNFGKITKEQGHLTELSEWKMLQKSLQKLKQVHKRSPFIEQKQYQNNRDRSISVGKRRKLFQT